MDAQAIESQLPYFRMLAEIDPIWYKTYFWGKLAISVPYVGCAVVWYPLEVSLPSEECW